MTGEQFVKTHHPRAWLRHTGNGGGGTIYEIRTGVDDDRVLGTSRRPLWAWGEAARRVKAEIADRKWAEAHPNWNA